MPSIVRSSGPSVALTTTFEMSPATNARNDRDPSTTQTWLSVLPGGQHRETANASLRSLLRLVKDVECRSGRLFAVVAIVRLYIVSPPDVFLGRRAVCLGCDPHGHSRRWFVGGLVVGFYVTISNEPRWFPLRQPARFVAREWVGVPPLFKRFVHDVPPARDA